MIVNHLFPLHRHFIIIQPKPLKHLGEQPSLGPPVEPVGLTDRKTKTNELLSTDPLTQLAFSVYESKGVFAVLLGSGLPCRTESMCPRLHP
jgi:hypothetical protein